MFNVTGTTEIFNGTSETVFIYSVTGTYGFFVNACNVTLINLSIVYGGTTSSYYIYTAGVSNTCKINIFSCVVRKNKTGSSIFFFFFIL
jgi:hypothetical protein